MVHLAPLADWPIAKPAPHRKRLREFFGHHKNKILDPIQLPGAPADRRTPEFSSVGTMNQTMKERP